MASYSGAGGHSSYSQPERSNETEQPYVVRLTPAVHSRLVQFFNRSENAGLRQSEVIDSLLNVSNTTSPPNQRSSLSTPVTRRRGLVTSVPIQQTPPKRVVTTRIVDDSPADDYGNNEDEDDVDEMDEDEELNYGDEYIYEEEVVGQDESPPPALSPSAPAPPENVHNYFYSAVKRTPASATTTRRRTLPAERRVTRQSSRPSLPGQRRKQCHPDRKAIGTGKQKPWTSNLRRYIYDLIAKFQRDYLLHCRECDRWMKVAHNRSGLRCVNVLDHVCGHLGKPMYACRLCQQQTVTSIQMRKHLKKVHGRTNDFDDLTESCYSELVERISRCFDYSDMGGPPEAGARRLLTCKRKRGETGVGQMFLSQEVDAESSSIRRFIYDLINKWQKENAIYCRQCSHWVRTGSESAWAQSQAALAHVCGHYGKTLYICLLCDERTVTYYQMIRHVRHVHQSISRGNCVDQTDEAEIAADLKQMAAKCFDWEEGAAPPALTADGPFLKKRRGETQPTPKKATTTAGTPYAHPGSCRPEALEFGRRLIREFGGNARTMKCQECDVVNVIKTIRGLRPEVLLDHALKHVDKDAYACPKCDKTAKKKDNMRVHLLNHKGVKSSAYIDKTGEMRDEILETMKRCFDTNYKKQDSEPAESETTKEKDQLGD